MLSALPKNANRVDKEFRDVEVEDVDDDLLSLGGEPGQDRLRENQKSLPASAASFQTSSQPRESEARQSEARSTF